MDWIDEIEEDAWNVVIDELVWHLREGRTLSEIRRRFEPRSGVEFCFEAAQPAFFSVEEKFLKEHWDDSIAIIRRFSQLRQVKTCDA